ncbi:uncharacterized protein A1O9_06049 [Exophiala aquamarina CBS 119918]|uniref:AB hydrolase-1 domain-containing protein n=1 Tax=Exophiala aquamarina CBS 119918 TaxID=1182545 RepID=A0A072PE36_9EURO|nr:uncharacterized protein A1O9_06049 [Exophiala aquamarina CBS 119918]KEF58126.1 hypothetical protein A1O9_06049 [Exophiala aquamarina CBS 119918]
MPYFTSSTDGARLHYVEYRPARTGPNAPARFAATSDSTKDFSADDQVTLVFIHGWPMSHRMYEHLLLRLSETHGVRCVASDRRGFGDSEWSGAGGNTGPITYDTFAQDTVDFLSTVFQASSDNHGSFYFVAASMGCGETALAYHLLGSSPALQRRCRGFIWLGASLPLPLKTDANPTAPPRELWDAILQGFRDDRVGFTRAAIPGVFGETFNIGIELQPTVKKRFESMVERADALALERCVQIITGTDLTEVVRRLDGLDVKILVVHGDNDQSMPAESSACIIPTLATQAQVKIYKNAAHGLYLTHADQVLEDIFAIVFGK